MISFLSLISEYSEIKEIATLYSIFQASAGYLWFPGNWNELQAPGGHPAVPATNLFR
jgi:hypothetical protein